MIILTFEVITPQMYGAIIPGIVAIQLVIPQRIPEYFPPTSLMFTMKPAPVHIPLKKFNLLILNTKRFSLQFNKKVHRLNSRVNSYSIFRI